MTSTPAFAVAAPAEPRRRILDGAVRCFARQGFHGTSMHQICAEADMSPGGLYRYFPSKDAIIEAIVVEERQRNAEFTSRLAVERDIVATLCEVGFAHLRELGRDRLGPLCAEVCAEAQRNERIRVVFEANHREVSAAILQALERARRLGEIDPAIDLESAVTTLMAIGDGLMVRMPFETEAALDRLFPALRDLVGRMLAPRAS